MKAMSSAQIDMLNFLRTQTRGYLVVSPQSRRQMRTLEALRRRGMVERDPNDFTWRVSRWGKMNVPKQV